MSEWLASGRLIDAIFGLMALEAIALLAYRHRTGRGVASLDLLVNLFAGGFLLLALRCALTGAGWMAVAASLSGALIAHVADLARRWRTHA